MSYYGSPMEEEIIRIVRFWRGQRNLAYLIGLAFGFILGFLAGWWAL